MLEQLAPAVGVTTPFATAIAMFYMIFTGRLYVKSAHEAVVRVLENQLTALAADRDSWRKSSEQKDAAMAVLVRTNSELMETAKFSNHVMSALQETAGGSTA